MLKRETGLFGVQNYRIVFRLEKPNEEALENIREAIELYLEPDLIKLKAGAILREVLEKAADATLKEVLDFLLFIKTRELQQE
jgi:hypothetical protein